MDNNSIDKNIKETLDNLKETLDNLIYNIENYDSGNKINSDIGDNVSTNIQENLEIYKKYVNGLKSTERKKIINDINPNSL